MSEQEPVSPALHPPTALRREWLSRGFWTALGAVLLALLAWVTWRLSAKALSIITPFALGLVFALLLDPLADRLERRGLRRGGAVGVVFGVFLLLLIGVGALVVPPLIDQAGRLAENGPQYVQKARAYVDDFLVHHRRIGTVTLPPSFDVLLAEFSERAAALVRSSAGRITALLVGSVTTVLETVVALIVTFYLLLDIDRLRARLFYLLPERARGPLGRVAEDIGGVFSDYLRGLLIVCVLYGIGTTLLFYGLAIAHRQMAGYALLVGAAAGILYAVPYIGALATALVTFLIAFASGGLGFGGIAVALTLLLNQIFDNVVTPRVVGGGVGLHPVAALFALTLGGALFGLAGLLLSVPIAASIQVILFHLFPKLTTPTPEPFLYAQGIRPEEAESSKILEGEEARAVNDPVEEPEGDSARQSRPGASTGTPE